MKSFVQNGRDVPVNLAAIGAGFLQPGQGAVVADSPAIVSRKLGDLARSMHVTQVPDSTGTTFGATGPATVAGGRVASDGTLQTQGKNNITSVVRNSAGSYTATLTVALVNFGSINILANANALASALDDVTPPSATAVAQVTDSTHVLVSTTNPTTGAPVDSAFSFNVIDFT